MAKNNDKISINKFESALNNNGFTEVILSGTEDVKIRITETISLNSMIEFVNTVVESCIDAENGDYVPEAYDFAIRVAVLTYYANFKMPSNSEKQYDLVYNTSAFYQIREKINGEQFHSIIKAIDKKIAFSLSLITSSAVMQIRELINRFSEIVKYSEDAFTGIDPKEMSGVMQKLSRIKNIDEKTVAEVILRQNPIDSVEVDKED